MPEGIPGPEILHRETDPTFQKMVDRNLPGYSGPSIVDDVTKRVVREARVTLGQAIYLSNNCRKKDVDRLESFLLMATDEPVRRALQTAIERAKRRL